MQDSHSHPAHHFTTREQQRDSAKFGMWIFLLTEMLLFGGLFTAYAVFRAWNPEMFLNSHLFLDRSLGLLNTIVLISSSVTIAIAVQRIQVNKPRQTATLLLVTLVLATIFLVVKYFEYSHKIHLGQLPGKFYSFTGVKGTNPHIFFSIYFAMTGLHLVHLVGGMFAIGGILWAVLKNRYSSIYYTPVENVALYWHLVDLIWIYLFPLLYLIG